MYVLSYVDASPHHHKESTYAVEYLVRTSTSIGKLRHGRRPAVLVRLATPVLLVPGILGVPTIQLSFSVNHGSWITFMYTGSMVYIITMKVTL
jgi:hypothetical protein